MGKRHAAYATAIASLIPGGKREPLSALPLELEAGISPRNEAGKLLGARVQPFAGASRSDDALLLPHRRVADQRLDRLLQRRLVKRV
jgi:hypothetical protein